MIVSVSRPSYFPLLKDIHRIILSDVHVIMDTIPFEEALYDNRCKIKTPNGWSWLHVPVLTEGDSRFSPLKDVKIYTGKPWEKKHLELILLSYKKAPYFKKYMPLFKELYKKKWKSICELNLNILSFILNELNIDKKPILSSELSAGGKHKSQLVHILEQSLATTYFAPPEEKVFLEEDDLKETFSELKLGVVYQNYKTNSYSQLHGNFIPDLSIIDMLFNAGPDALQLITKGNLKKIKE